MPTNFPPTGRISDLLELKGLKGLFIGSLSSDLENRAQGILQEPYPVLVLQTRGASAPRITSGASSRDREKSRDARIHGQVLLTKRDSMRPGIMGRGCLPAGKHGLALVARRNPGLWSYGTRVPSASANEGIAFYDLLIVIVPNS